VQFIVGQVGQIGQALGDGVIHNGSQLLSGWENFATNCDLTVTGSSAGCNAGHGNRLYFRADGYWWGFAF
jgi:hypothetical protein